MEENTIEKTEIQFCETIKDLQIMHTRYYDQENQNQEEKSIFEENAIAQNIHKFKNLRSFKGLPSPSYEMKEWLNQHFPHDKEENILKNLQILEIPLFPDLVVHWFSKDKKKNFFPFLKDLKIHYPERSYKDVDNEDLYEIGNLFLFFYIYFYFLFNFLFNFLFFFFLLNFFLFQFYFYLLFYFFFIFYFIFFLFFYFVNFIFYFLFYFIFFYVP